MSFLQVEELAKRYGSVAVFERVSFTIEKGQFVCIIGHSGCGKTTILNILAGLEDASGGVVVMDNREVAGPSLDRGVVFQGHALMPWLSVMSNIAFAVKSRWPDWNRIQVQTHCQKFIDMVALTRGTIQDELVRICEATHQTVFMITHDVDEAMLLADRIMLMSNGPNACIAEIVLNPVAKPRERHSIHHAPQYYGVRNHLVDFLVNRSKRYQSGELRAQRVSSAKIVNLR